MKVRFVRHATICSIFRYTTKCFLLHCLCSSSTACLRISLLQSSSIRIHIPYCLNEFFTVPESFFLVAYIEQQEKSPESSVLVLRSFSWYLHFSLHWISFISNTILAVWIYMTSSVFILVYRISFIEKHFSLIWCHISSQNACSPTSRPYPHVELALLPLR